MKNGIKITTYVDSKKEWRWRMSRGGRIVADSGEGYSAKGKAKRAATNLTEAISQGKYEHAEADPVKKTAAATFGSPVKRRSVPDNT